MGQTVLDVNGTTNWRGGVSDSDRHSGEAVVFACQGVRVGRVDPNAAELGEEFAETLRTPLRCLADHPHHK